MDEGLTEERFWDLIREAQGLGHASADPDRLKSVLERLSSEEIASFGRLFYVKLCDLNSWRLWAAGYVIAGGMGDDHFHYFRSWIIGKGRAAFETALSDPDQLGTYIDSEDVDNELLEYVAVHLLQSRGLADPREADGRFADGPPTGEPFEEDSVGVMVPNLWAKFSGEPMPDEPTKPPTLVPPPRLDGRNSGAQKAQTPPTPPQAPKNALQKMWSAFLAFIAATWKFAYPVFKLAKGAKLLLTGSSMLLSMWFYSLRFGWPFAAGFVICILIHEMGHVLAGWLIGLPVSAPVFIPGFGALILSKRLTETGWQSAVMGIGGPIFGTLAAFGCWAIYALTGNELFLGLAYTGFFMNLFNMIPVFPLDGGWITGAVSPYMWIGGLAFMLFLAITGFVHNIFIWVLIILSLPRIVSAFKKGTVDIGAAKTTSMQRTLIGIAYVSLCVILVWGVASTYEGGLAVRRVRSAPAVQ